MATPTTDRNLLFGILALQLDFISRDALVRAMYAWVQSPQGVPRTTLHSKEVPSAENAWSGQNYPGYRNPAMDAALDAAERELDPAKRRALFADIQRIHAEDLPVLPLFFRVDPFVIPKQLKGVTPTGHLNSSTLWIEQWRWEN